MRKLKPETIADRLGQIRAEINELVEQREALRDQLADYDLEVAVGKHYKVTLSQVERQTVDWRGVAEAAKIPDRTIQRYTRTVPTTRLLVQAR